MGVHAQLADVLTAQNQSVPTPITGFGLIDTGASVTAVDDQALARLGILPIAVIQVGTAGGQRAQQQYPAQIRFTQFGFDITFATVIGADLTGMGILALIGRDVLSRALLVYNGTLGHFILSF